MRTTHESFTSLHCELLKWDVEVFKDAGHYELGLFRFYSFSTLFFSFGFYIDGLCIIVTPARACFDAFRLFCILISEVLNVELLSLVSSFLNFKWLWFFCCHVDLWIEISFPFGSLCLVYCYILFYFIWEREGRGNLTSFPIMYYVRHHSASLAYRKE